MLSGSEVAMRPLAAVALALVLSPPALAQSPAFLVKDVNVQPGAAVGSGVDSIHVAGGVALFAATTPTLGRELWRSDGTEGGTTLVRERSLGENGAFPRGFAAGSGTTYFAQGSELWRTDGTAAGTTLVTDPPVGQLGLIVPAAGPIGALSAGGFLFAADDGVASCGLWRTDGTAAGTSFVHTFPRTFGNSPNHFRAIGGVVFFTANGGTTGVELWRSDGTPGGTSIVADLAPGTASSTPLELTAIGSELYFSAVPNATIGRELYKTDGTPGGTVRVKDTRVPGSGTPTEITLAGGVIYFAVAGASGRQLWKSDGTEPGTVLVATFPFASGSSDAVTQLEALGSAVVFRGHSAATGLELWTSDGATTQLVSDVWPGSSDGVLRNLRTVGSYVYFSVGDTASGGTLWRSDGTAAGTIPLGAFSGGAIPLGTLDGTTLLLQGVTADLGGELWRSDGTVAGTALVKNIAFDASNGLVERGDPDRADLDGTLIFDADDGLVGQAVWRSDGTSTGTTLVSDWSDPAADTGFGFATSYWRAGAQVFFLGSDLATGLELWRTDGTAVGTGLVADIEPGPQTSFVLAGFDFDGVLLFSAFTLASGRELWRSDGTPAGTFLLADLAVVPGQSSAPLDFTRVGSSVFFTAVPTGAADRRLWRTDGTAAGTVLVAAAGMSSPSALTAIGGLLYFSARDSLGAWGIWRSDGTAAGTFALPVPVAAGDFPGALVGLNGALIYMTQAESGGGTRIWGTDGTAVGTSLLADLGAAFGVVLGAQLRVLGNRVLFGAPAPELGASTLFASDGTPAGTGRVKTHGTVPLSPANLTVIGDRLVFTSCDADAGCEPWVTDGTDGGTRRLADIGPDTDSSNPRRFIRSGDFVYFSAQDSRGRELWAVPLSALSLAACEDGFDNDGDGAIDAGSDPGCFGPKMRTESPECDDGVDNDGDGTIDLDDPTCGGNAWAKERQGACGLLGIEGAVFAGAALARLRALRRRKVAAPAA
jgi:ELWxxDGT repeat protein